MGVGVDEGMHPRLHVPRRCTAGHGRGHQNPEQAGEDSLLGNGEWGIDEGISATRGPHELKSDGKKDREIEPGADAARLVHELEAKDLPELHGLPSDVPCSRRRPMRPAIGAEVDIFEVWLGGLKAGTWRRIAVDVGDGASRVELRRDHRVLSFQIRESFPRNLAAPDPAVKLVDRAAAARLRAGSPLCR